jgi:hypothetical protein
MDRIDDTGRTRAQTLRAMRKAVELGVFPKHVMPEEYVKNWKIIEAIVDAALDEMSDILDEEDEA